MEFHCTQPFIINLLLSWYNWNTVEEDVKSQPIHPSLMSFTKFNILKLVMAFITLTLLLSEQPKLHGVLAFLSAVGLTCWWWMDYLDRSISSVRGVRFMSVLFYLSLTKISISGKQCRPWSNATFVAFDRSLHCLPMFLYKSAVTNSIKNVNLNYPIAFLCIYMF